VGGQRHAPVALPQESPVPIVLEAVCAPGPVWTDAKNLAHKRIRPRAVQLVANRYSGYAARFNMYIQLFGVCYFVRWVS